MKRLLLFLVVISLVPIWAYADVDCKEIHPCKYTRAGTGCEREECPAFLITVDKPGVSFYGALLYDMEGCDGEILSTSVGDITFAGAGTWIVPFRLGTCDTAGANYSITFFIDKCDEICGEYTCGSPQPPCEGTDAELPVIDLQDFR